MRNRPKSATRLPSSHNGRQYGKADGRINSAEVLSASCKNLMNFDPLTPEFMVMVWQPLIRQMGEIGQTRSSLGTRIRQWMAGTAELICAKFTSKTYLVLRLHELERQGQKSKVKVTRDKNALCTHNTPTVRTKWNNLVADNVAQAAGASILLLARGVFAGCVAVRWAWRATAGLCHAFLVLYFFDSN